MLAKNEVTRSNPLFIHAQGSEHKCKKWEVFADQIIDEQNNIELPYIIIGFARPIAATLA